jgi:hypothetical protein
MDGCTAKGAFDGRPRQTLGWSTLEEAMAKELENAGFANRCT